MEFEDIVYLDQEFLLQDFYGVGHNGHTVNKSSKIQSFIKKSLTLVRHAKIVILTQKVILGEINI